MKYHRALLLLSAFFFLPVLGQKSAKLIILHSNDLHSRLLGFAPESAYTPLTINDDNTVGGFARIAAVIGSEKQVNPGQTLVLDAGDFLMGTLFPSLEVKTGFQLRLMKKMGYDAVGLGNHEFDFGPGWLADVMASSASKGDIPVMLAGNIITDSKSDVDDGIEKLYSKNILKHYIVLERAGIRIGIFSIIGKDAQRVAPKAAPLKFVNPEKEAKQMVSELKKEKCDIIICISHSGVKREKNGGMGGDDVNLAKNVKGIDLIVGGHSHTKIDQPLVVNGTLIVQTGEFGENLGRLELSISGGKVKMENYRLIPIDDKIQGDKVISHLIDEQKTKINDQILNNVGMDYDKPVAESGFVIEGNDGGDFINSNLGPLVADAIYYYVNRHCAKGTDITMLAAGMLFDKILPGIQMAPDFFRVVPLGTGQDNIPGYPLSRLYVTGHELKSILEILLVAWKSSPDNYCYYSGMKVLYSPEKGLFKKIKKIEILHGDGSVANVDFAKKDKTMYSITADSYMLEFIGIIKKMSFGLVNVVPKDASGLKVTDMKTAVLDADTLKDGIQEAKEWLALLEYLGSMKDTNGNGIPDIDGKYKVPVRSLFPVDPK